MQIQILIVDNCVGKNRGYKGVVAFTPKGWDTVETLAGQAQDALQKKWKLSQLDRKDQAALNRELIVWIETHRGALDIGDTRNYLFEFQINLPPPIPMPLTTTIPSEPQQRVELPKPISSLDKER